MAQGRRRKVVSWSSDDPDGILAWNIAEEAPELAKVFRGCTRVSADVHFIVYEVPANPVVYPVTVSWDVSRDFFGDLWAAMRDARQELIVERGLRVGEARHRGHSDDRSNSGHEIT
jgi:hypothetical protein